MKKFNFVICLFFIFSCFSLYACNSANDSKVSEYEIECSLEGEYVNGREKFTYYNDTDNLIDSLVFNLHANAFRQDASFSAVPKQYQAQAYIGKVNYGGYEIKGVTNEEGSPLNFEVCGSDKNLLKVNLTEGVYPDEKCSIVIDYTIKLANVIARTGINAKTINLANFYPILCAFQDGEFYECIYYSNGDPYYSDVANYKITFTADKEYLVASSGSLEKQVDNGGSVTHYYQIDNARNFCLVLCKEFSVITDESLGVKINYYYYDDNAPQESLQTAVKSVSLFNQKFGVYPYKSYSVVQTQFLQGGMEFTALAMISDTLETPAYKEVIVHETAHQWWHGVVGNNEIEYGFLDESLAEYSVVMFYENYDEYGMDRDMLIDSSLKTYHAFCDVWKKLFDKVDTSMTRSLKDFSSEYEYVNIAYVKGCIMHDTLRESVGDDKYFTALKRYYKENSFKNARPENLVGAFEKTGCDTNGFFASFFDGSVII